VDGLAGRVAGRLRTALADGAEATVAAALAWELARLLFGHPHPVFAAVSAIICLAPGLPNHGRQAVGVILGVATGIVVGEAALLLPDTIPTLRVSVATFGAIMIATTYGQPAVVPIQAGVSAMLVLAMGSEYAGPVRMLDVACGTAVGLLFSQILFTPDPVEQLRESERSLLGKVGAALRQAEAALQGGDQEKAQAALRTFSDAHASLVGLATGIDNARLAASWSLRGRLRRRDLREVADRFGRRSTRAYAAALLFGSALATAMQRRPGQAPASLGPGIAAAIRLCNLAEPMGEAPPLPLAGVDDDWRRCLVRLSETMDAIRWLREAEVSGGGISRVK
jgi:uncharacterized membrane protein YgaE (UPF0421/DUF939 family)